MGRHDDTLARPASELRPRARGAIVGLAVGVIAGALGVLVAMVVLKLSGDVTYVPLVGAAAIAVWGAGGRGGIASIVTGWTLAMWALTPETTFVIESDDEFVRFGVALAVGVIVAGVGFAMRREHDHAADAVEERRSRETLDRILAVAPRFEQGPTTAAVMVSICVEACHAFGCDVAQVWTPIDDDELEVTWRNPPSDVLPPGTRIAFVDFPALADEMRALRSMFVPDAQSHTRGAALAHAQELGVFSSLRIPIVIDAQFERILTLQWERIIAEPEPSEIAVARRFADQAGLAIERAERYRAEEQTRTLQDVTEALAAAATPADVGTAVVRQGVAALGAVAATVYALAEDGKSLELLASEGYASEVIAARKRIPIEAGTPITDALRTREIVACGSIDEIAMRYPRFDRAETSFVAAPLVVVGRAIGVVLISPFEGSQLGPPGMSTVIGLARQAGQALDRAQLFEREQALTGRLQKLQAVTSALSKAVSAEDVARTCLDYAAAGVGARDGFVVLRRPDSTKGSSTVAIVAAIGTVDSADGIPPGAAASIAAAMKDGSAVATDAGWISFPLATGALTVRSPSGLQFAADDRAWLETLVTQASLALHRAGRFETEREIAETLQRSVLPERLPSLHGIRLAAEYLPGTVGVEVGGDWYDVIHLGRGFIGLVVGDVVGKGVHAAATMGQLRNALRAFAFEHDDPYEVISRLDRLVEGMTETPFATLAYLVFDPRVRHVRYIVAGHPPPLVRSPDGTTRYLDGGRTLPIGVDASLSFEAGEVHLERGSTIVLYTDGLVERPDRPLDTGLDLLARAATAADDDDPRVLVDALLAALVGSNERPDDVAVLAVRFTEAAVEDFTLVSPSTQEGLVEMRQSLRGWLALGNVETEAAADVLLATWEACVNAVEHAQQPAAPTFELRAMLDDAGWIRIEVRDSGQWKRDEGSDDRGLGLKLMRSLMETVDVNPSNAGTRVVMERQADPEA